MLIYGRATGLSRCSGNAARCPFTRLFWIALINRSGTRTDPDSAYAVIRLRNRGNAGRGSVLVLRRSHTANRRLPYEPPFTRSKVRPGY